MHGLPAMDRNATPIIPPSWLTPLGVTALSVCMFAIYSGLTYLGLHLYLEPEHVATMWPACGVLLAVFYSTRRVHWIANAVGYVAAVVLYLSLTSDRNPFSVALISSISVTEAAIGAWLLRKYVGPKIELTRLKHFVTFIAVGAVATTTICPLIGAARIVLADPTLSYWRIFQVWWFADALGVLLTAPLVLAWLPVIKERRAPVSREQLPEVTALFAMLVMTATLVFCAKPGPLPFIINQPLIILLPLLWAALRFQPAIVTAALLIVGAFAIECTIRGLGPFVGRALNVPDLVLLVQAFLAFSITAMLGLTAVTGDRKRVIEALLASERAALEQRSQLDNLLANVDAIIREGDASGIHFVGGQVEKLLGYPRQAWFDHPEGPVGLWCQLMHPDDRHQIKICSDAICRGESYTSEYRLIAENGRIVWFYDSVTVETRLGEPTTVRSVMTDITTRKRAEEQVRQSETNYRSLADNHPAGVTVVVDGRIEYANARMSELSGYAVSDIVGRMPSEFVMAVDSDRTENRIAALSKGAAEYPSSYEIVRKDGSTISVEVASNTTQYQGKPALLCVLTDITQRTIDEQALLDSEARFRSYFDLGLVGIAITSPDKGWIEVNDRLCEILGYSREDLTSTTWAAITHPDDLDKDIRQYERVLAGETNGYSLEKRFVQPDGNVIEASIDVNCLRHSDGRVNYFVAMVQDITELREAVRATTESNTRLQMILNTALDYITVLSLDGTIQYINRVATGRTVEEVIGSSVFDYIAPADHATMRTAMATVIETKEPYQFESETIGADGSREWYSCHIGPHIIDGEVKSLTSCTIDITDHKLAELALEQSQERLDLALRGTSDGLWDWWLDTGEGYWSPRYLEMLGYDEDELVATFENFQALVHPDEVSVVTDAAMKHINENVPFDVEYRLRTKSGEYRWFQARGKAMRNENGEPYRMTGSIRDITDRVTAEDQLRLHQEQLAHVARITTMGEMATGIAHELNQPLAAIASYSHAAKLNAENNVENKAQFVNLLEKVKDQAIRAGDIVRRLRSFVNKTGSQHVPTDLNELVDDVIMLVEPDIRETRTRLDLNLDESSPCVLVDKIQIQQVLVNLIRNALDAMQDTPVEHRSVLISTRVIDHEVAEVTVCDAGEGLSDDEARQVFDTFYSTKQEGMGMGLAISRSIVEAHEGQLWAKPNAGAGVTFGFTIGQAKNAALT